MDLQGQVVHLKSIDEPKLPSKTADITSNESQDQVSGTSDAVSESPKDHTIHTSPPTSTGKVKETSSDVPAGSVEAWPTDFTEKLTPLLSHTVVDKLKELYLEGPEPPFVSDGGWQDRQSKPGNGTAEDDATAEPSASKTLESQHPRRKDNMRGRRGKDKIGRGRGGKGARGGRQDNRKVLSDVRIQPIYNLFFCNLHLTIRQSAHFIQTRAYCTS